MMGLAEVPGKVAKLARIWRNEGLSGLLGRARYRRSIALSQIPPAPDLSAGVRLVDHGHPALAQMIALYLTDLGISQDRLNGPALHIGWPQDGAMVAPDDIVIAAPSSHPWTLPKNLPRLIVEHCAQRLDLLGQCLAGQPHVLAIPALPQSSAPSDWHAYAQDNRFALDRFALFCGALALDRISYVPQLKAAMAHDKQVRVCLSMPETLPRRAAFLARGLDQFTLVDGLKRHPSWKGAASSYHMLARAALEMGLSQLTVAQDDMLPAPGFHDKLARIEAYFPQSGADMFSGLITDVDDSFTAENAVNLGDIQLISLNKSIGLVFNIFSLRALERLAAWDESAVDVEVNTIDRFLGRTKGLHVLTALPPLVSHDDALQSSIWSFSNARYNSLIAASHRRLEKMARNLKS